jgi:hypothetical protein
LVGLLHLLEFLLLLLQIFLGQVLRRPAIQSRDMQGRQETQTIYRRGKGKGKARERQGKGNRKVIGREEVERGRQDRREEKARDRFIFGILTWCSRILLVSLLCVEESMPLLGTNLTTPEKPYGAITV